MGVSSSVLGRRGKYLKLMRRCSINILYKYGVKAYNVIAMAAILARLVGLIAGAFICIKLKHFSNRHSEKTCTKP